MKTMNKSAFRLDTGQNKNKIMCRSHKVKSNDVDGLSEFHDNDVSPDELKQLH